MRRRRQRTAMVGVAVAALALHAIFLSGTALWWPSTPAAVAVRESGPSVSVRTIARAPPVPRVEPVAASTTVDPPLAAVPAQVPAVVPRTVVAARARPLLGPGMAAPPLARLSAPLTSPLPSPSPSPSPSPVAVVPHERTQVAERAPALDRAEVAPSTLLRYRATRGARVGRAELQWQVADRNYEARLEIVFDGDTRAAVQQSSRGRIDTAGVVPERHTDRRARGGLQAASFEPDTGEVSFSGPSWRLAMAPGVQDRLSWLLQLAAVVEADPQRAVADGEVVIPVVGVRGDGRDWRFRVDASEVAPPASLADVSARPIQKWLREPTEPYDTRVEVWLDPARHHLPVRLRMGPASGAMRLELTLDE